MDSSIIGIIILAITLILFVTQKVPLPVAAMIGALLMMFAGILTPAEVCGFFGNHICLLLAGMAIVSGAIFETGLSDKLGDSITKVKLFTEHPKVFLIVIVIASGVMSMFIANIPVIAFFMMVSASVAAVSKGKIQKKFLYMAIGFGAQMGGNGTLVGSSINLTGQAALIESTGESLGMFTLMPITVILLIVMVAYYATIGDRLQKKVFDFPEVKDDVGVEKAKTEFKPVKAVIVLTTFVGMMILFINNMWNFGTVAATGALIVVLTGCISWPKALARVEWGIIITLAGALALASGVNSSGAGTLIANTILDLCGGASASPLVILIVAILLASVLGCIMQHNPICAILIPIFGSIATVLGVSAIPFAVAVIVGCNNCFVTPIGTVSITMTLAGGYRFNDFVKVGTPLFILTAIAMCIGIPLLYPF